eukprot:CAMPEP_0197910132 /NCGR_PEP_ID=MMETSP1439-20131203/70301_1 /TAXON_ID=66791 /ORGANISM="Gonyaulax spinifera, Strain CCMP409" /LENGTH=542 /DNA_ID=CAMNT_0043531755 /DNA_START=50 /DNA_END=1674 /DNA_ORIENTATION=-
MWGGAQYDSMMGGGSGQLSSFSQDGGLGGDQGQGGWPEAGQSAGWYDQGQQSSGGWQEQGRPRGEIGDAGDADQSQFQLQPYSEEGDSPEKKKLVDEVKRMQRSSELSKAKWYTFCHLQGNWCYDPSRHTEASLHEFLSMIDSPALMRGPEKEIGEGETHHTLAQQVKQVQKSGFRESWYAFCMWFQMSMDYDPFHFSADVLKCFLNCVVAAQLPKDDDTAFPSDTKMALVNQVKEAQKAGFRDHWCAYNLMFKWTSDLDPCRHQDRFLKKFVDCVGLAKPIYEGTAEPAKETKERPERPERPEHVDASEISSQVFVGGLPKAGADQEVVKQFFSQFGKVEDVILKFDENQNFRGFGFVNFDSPETAKIALEHPDSTMFHGKQLNLEPASAKGAKGGSKSSSRSKGKGAKGFDLFGDMMGWGGGDWGDWGMGGFNPMEMLSLMAGGPMAMLKGKSKGKGKGKKEDSWSSDSAGGCSGKSDWSEKGSGGRNSWSGGKDDWAGGKGDWGAAKSDWGGAKGGKGDWGGGKGDWGGGKGDWGGGKG